MTEVTIRFPKLLAIFSAVVGVPVLAALTIGFTVMTFLLHTVAMPLWKIGLAYLIFSSMAVFLAVGTVTIFRYGRESLFTTFRISNHGIGIENRRYGLLQLAWPDIEGATYSQIGKTIVLNSPRLLNPIAIMYNPNAESTEFQAAVAMVRQNLQGRFSTKWI